MLIIEKQEEKIMKACMKESLRADQTLRGPGLLEADLYVPALINKKKTKVSSSCRTLPPPHPSGQWAIG